ncbi:MAG: gamma carbonic anhydrase family protein [Selenomonadaceae bacterium]|nr:gamma carbonic anhydrase family protein [Selenomonadaceae bacterium]MBR6905627.1 gamma carbonic anhydrase family protein [Selenomonadaceae bacterium]
MGFIMPLEGKAPQIHPSVFVAPSATVVGDVVIGEHSSLWFSTIVRGDFQPVRIGSYTNIQDNATIHVMGDEPTEIGNHVIIGHNAIIHSRHIGNNCLIGMGSILLGHTEIGDNCIIGAGTLLTQHKKIPANCLVYGNPARIIRALRDDEIEALIASSLNYYDYAQKYIAELAHMEQEM